MECLQRPRAPVRLPVRHTRASSECLCARAPAADLPMAGLQLFQVAAARVAQLVQGVPGMSIIIDQSLRLRRTKGPLIVQRVIRDGGPRFERKRISSGAADRSGLQ